MATQPIIKLLTSHGAGSRRKMTETIKRGLVAVNGKVIESFIHPVNTETDRITINGKPFIIEEEPMVYLLLNKPRGILSTTSDDRSRKTVMEFIPYKYRQIRLYPVGRLDEDSTGLLLLTNDGDLTFQLTHPRYEHEKEYLVQIFGSLKPEEMRSLENGVKLEDGKTSPAKIRTVNKPPFNYAITIHEGKKRQIRRMFAFLGYHVQELRRIRLGSLKLEALAEGKTRELTPIEIRLLKGHGKSPERKVDTNKPLRRKYPTVKKY
jgi:23S rRNA pseudouridine2605 synthase